MEERRSIMLGLRDINIRGIKVLPSPTELFRKLPISIEAGNNVLESRDQIADILSGRDKRFIIIAGPCSIHDIPACLDYADKLSFAAKKFKNKLLIVMRTYFEKPRTVIGWEGFISDPNLNDTFDMWKGLYDARVFLQSIAGLGLPAATEFVDPITPQYIADLVSWAAVGARTVESQVHRRMASGLSMPIGFKNGTEGNIQVAVDAAVSAQNHHSFFGIDLKGQAAIISTNGNPCCHLVLRGGNSGPNFDRASITYVAERLIAAGLRLQLVVDCSHGNSDKDHKKQSIVFMSVLNQRVEGNKNIVGLMLESNLFPGSQKLNNGNGNGSLKYGVSVTDSCMGWEETLELLEEAYGMLN